MATQYKPPQLLKPISYGYGTGGSGAQAQSNPPPKPPQYQVPPMGSSTNWVTQYDPSNFPTTPNTPGPWRNGYVPYPGGASNPSLDMTNWAPAASQVPNWAEDPNMNGVNAAIKQAADRTAGTHGGGAGRSAIDPYAGAADWIQAAMKAHVDPNRVVSVYMNPNDPHAASDPHRALADAIADDIWGNAATQAFGRPPTQQEWVEHYYAKNYGSRDPLEGHSEAIASIQRQANALTNQGQSMGQEQAMQDMKNAGLIP